MADRAILAAALLGAGALFLYSRSASAGLTDGGFVNPGSLPGSTGPVSLASDLNALFSDYERAVTPQAADYEDALPGTPLFNGDVWEWPQTGAGGDAMTPADVEDMEAGGWSWDDLIDGWTSNSGGFMPVGLTVNGEKNLRAILAAIRWAEGTADENGYRALYGYRPGNNKLFDSFADHPRLSFKTPWGPTSAAGAYQMQAATWDEAANSLGLMDFSPGNQDKAAVWIIDQKRKALADVLAGRLQTALYKLRREWASLPTSDSGQPKRAMDEFLRQYLSFGGDVSGGDTTTYV